MSFEQIAEALKKYHPAPDLVALKKAYDFAEECHRGQVRASGDPYFKHVEETAMLVCQLKLDEPSVIASLLHDTIEDSDVTRDDLQKSKPSSGSPTIRTDGIPAMSDATLPRPPAPSAAADRASRTTSCPNASRLPTTTVNATPSMPPIVASPREGATLADSAPRTARFDAAPNAPVAVSAKTVGTARLNATAGMTPVSLVIAAIRTYPQ